MTKPPGAIWLALLLIGTFPSLAQKKASTPAIRFQGAPQYTQQELLAAAGLKSDRRLNAAEVKARAKQLNDTGLFKEVKFSTDSKGLLFTLTPATQLYPMHLDNVPLTPGPELEAKLHEQVPLYRDLLPPSGSVDEGICRALEEMLAAKGAKSTVKAALTSGLGPKKITAVNFSVVSPMVRIGRIELSGVSPAMAAKVNVAASGQTGNGFDTENTASGLQHVFEDLYQDQGYAAVQVSVAQADALNTTDQAIDVPFRVTIKEGEIYKLGNLEVPPGSLVSRAEIQKLMGGNARGSGGRPNQVVVAVRDAYSAKGYLDSSVVLHPSFDEHAHTVNYSLEINPGPQYRFASVRFEGAPEAMAAKLKSAWKPAPGDVFDQSYLTQFTAQAQKKDKALAKWMQTVITTYDAKPDPATHDVTCIFHFSKAAQDAK